MATASNEDPVVASEEDPVVGIDLGTTYSCVAVYRNGQPRVLANDHGNRITPSVVSFTEGGFVVGDEASRRLTIDPKNTVYEIKRLLGRSFDDPVVQEDLRYWPFTVVDKDGKPKILITTNGEDKLYGAEEISAFILANMKSLAEKELRKEVQKAVITVPAYFNESQRQATKDAARLAGLEVQRIINEPTAAALAYGLQKKTESERHVLIFDLGGGTFDVTIFKLDEGFLQVIATGGDTHLGGVDFDNTLSDECLNFFNKKEDIKEEVRIDRQLVSFHRLRRACQLSKHELSSHEESTVFVEMFHENVNLDYPISRKILEDLIKEALQKTLAVVQRTIEDAGIDYDDLDDVVLVGGSTRIPLLREMLKEQVRGKRLNLSINPDEAVACGAAIQAAILSDNPPSELDECLLMDVTPLSLGIELKGSIMLTVVKRNTHIPCRDTSDVTTVKDEQTVIAVKIYQGERPLTKENHYLGSFDLTGIKPEPLGVPKVQVTFDLDTDGCLKVTATDKKTGNKKSIEIQSNRSRYSEKDIAKLLEEAEKYREEDQREKGRIVARNRLEEFALWMRYILTNHASDVGLSMITRQSLLGKLADCLSWLNSNVSSSKLEYVERLGHLKTAVKDIPPEYCTPGKLPNQENYTYLVRGLGAVVLEDNEYHKYETIPDVD